MSHYCVGGIWQHLTINSDDIGGLLHGNHLDESSIVWPKSTRTINSDDIGVGGYSMATISMTWEGGYSMATAYIHKMSHLLSGLRVLVL